MSDSDILERAKAQFDVNRAKEAANRFAEWMLHNPAGTVDISDAVLSAWGYPAAVAEIERLRNLPRADVAAYDRRIQEMAARIKELQDLIDKPPEEADWVADYHLLQSALDGPIIDAARKWHAAYRKAQNSNLMRAKEVERLQRLMDVVENTSRLRSNRLEEQIEALVIQKSAKAARIKEQEADLRKAIDARDEWIEIANQERRIRDRLEAAFLDSLAARLYYEHYPGVSDAYSWHDYPEEACHSMPKEEFRKKAHEALERIKEGGKDVP